jgi:hypothetical protein
MTDRKKKSVLIWTIATAFSFICEHSPGSDLLSLLPFKNKLGLSEMFHSSLTVIVTYYDFVLGSGEEKWTSWQDA